MITCFVRYHLNMDQIAAFEQYAKIWIPLIHELGGTHHGYFLPSNDEKAKNHGRFSFQGLGQEGPTNIGVAIFSFPDWATYEHYRSEAGNYDACKRATKLVEQTKCFTKYERNFMTMVQ